VGQPQRRRQVDVRRVAPAAHLFGRDRGIVQMKVNVPTPLRSYTAQAKVVEGEGSTLGDVLASIEAQYPGFRFRIIDEQDSIREHIKIFVNEDQAVDLRAPVRSNDTIHIICALSGGANGG